MADRKALTVVVDTMPGVVSLDPFFDALFALAERIEQRAPARKEAA